MSSVRQMILYVLLLVAPSCALSDVPARILYVIDGDTFRAVVKTMEGHGFETSIRVAGIDAPESKYGFECTAERQAGYAATKFAKTLLKKRQVVFLSEIRPDKYDGRIVAKVSLPDGRSFGEVMLQAQHAIAYHGGRKRKVWCMDDKGRF